MSSALGIPCIPALCATLQNASPRLTVCWPASGNQRFRRELRHFNCYFPKPPCFRYLSTCLTAARTAERSEQSSIPPVSRFIRKQPRGRFQWAMRGQRVAGLLSLPLCTADGDAKLVVAAAIGFFWASLVRGSLAKWPPRIPLRRPPSPFSSPGLISAQVGYPA